MDSDRPARGLARLAELGATFAEQRQKREAAAPDIAREEEALKAAFARRRLEAFPTHLAACGVPEMELEWLTSPELDRQHPALLWVRHWARGPKRFAILHGPNGRGKTVAAASALWFAVHQVVTYAHPLADVPLTLEEFRPRLGYFLKARELRHLPESDWQCEGQPHSFESLCRLPWLVVDELGREGEDTRGEWKARLNALVDIRHARRLRTVFTSNLHPEAQTPQDGGPPLPSLRTWVGVAAADRLAADADSFDVTGLPNLRARCVAPRVRLVR